MTDLHEVSGSSSSAQMDKVGWMFAVLVVVITTIAGIVAYQGNHAIGASSPAAHVSPSVLTDRR